MGAEPLRHSLSDQRQLDEKSLRDLQGILLLESGWGLAAISGYMAA